MATKAVMYALCLYSHLSVVYYGYTYSLLYISAFCNLYVVFYALILYLPDLAAVPTQSPD